MRKVFAWIEVAAAMVLAVFAVVGYIRIKLDSTVVLARNFAETTRNYRQVVINGKNSTEAVYQVIPHWKESLIAGRDCATDVKTVCDNLYASIPVVNWPDWAKKCCLGLKSIPYEYSQKSGQIKLTLEKSIEFLDSRLEKQEHEQVIQAFDKTISSLDAMESSFSNIHTEFAFHSLTILIILLSLSVCFFANGMVCILETKKELKPR